MGRIVYAQRLDLRKQPIVRFGQRMKPKSWTCEFWFRSALFERGSVSRRGNMAVLMTGGRAAR